MCVELSFLHHQSPKESTTETVKLYEVDSSGDIVEKFVNIDNMYIQTHVHVLDSNDDAEIQFCHFIFRLSFIFLF